MKKRREQLVCLRRRIVQRNEKLWFLLLHFAFVGDVAQLFLEIYAGRENHVRLDCFSVERLFIHRSLAAKAEAHCGEFAELNTETVFQITR